MSKETSITKAHDFLIQNILFIIVNPAYDFYAPHPLGKLIFDKKNGVRNRKNRYSFGDLIQGLKSGESQVFGSLAKISRRP